ATAHSAASRPSAECHQPDGRVQLVDDPAKCRVQHGGQGAGVAGGDVMAVEVDHDVPDHRVALVVAEVVVQVDEGHVGQSRLERRGRVDVGEVELAWLVARVTAEAVLCQALDPTGLEARGVTDGGDLDAGCPQRQPHVDVPVGH